MYTHNLLDLHHLIGKFLQPCPGRRDDYRHRQCAVYNRTPYMGKMLRWRPFQKCTVTLFTIYFCQQKFLKSQNQFFSFFCLLAAKRKIHNVKPCALTCMARKQGRRFVVKFADDVLIGTPCKHIEGSNGVCIDKICLVRRI